MKNLHFMYRMEFFFDSPVSNHHFTLKGIPANSERQEITDLHISVDPENSLTTGSDSLGNLCIYGCNYGSHNSFTVEISGNALTGLSAAEKAEDINKIGFYRYPTALTAAGSKLSGFHDSFRFPENISNAERAKIYAKELHRLMKYQPGATGVMTTAEEAFCSRTGVCQDFAHIILALCRIDRIPARYVVGMMTGEGKSHAWTEIYDNGYWYALDPTNNCQAADDYIIMSCGPDAAFCKINKGIFAGCTSQHQEVSVSVFEI